MTSTNKNLNGDFLTTITSVRSSPNAVGSTDATRSQYLVLPEMDFSGKTVDSLEFFERRTSTYQARLLVEAALGNNSAFNIRISKDSLRLLSSSSYIRRSFALPETLSGRPSVRLRIRTIADTTGSTGVYRIDDIRLTVRKNADLGLSTPSVIPAIPQPNDSLTISVWVKNRALSGTFSGTLILYDSLTSISIKNFSSYFAAGDSLLFLLTHPSLAAGRHPLKITVQCNGDEDSTNNTVILTITTGFRKRALLLNEFIYLPSAAMPEWLEVINAGRDTILLGGWKISDGGTTKAAITPSDRMIAPGAYGVITTDTNAFKNFYPSSFPLFQASFSALNNGGDAVVVFDPTNSVIDSLSYLSSWGGSTGRSLERIDTAAESAQQTNWKTSLHPHGATPGMINSVTPKQFDAAVARMITIPNHPVAGKGSESIVTIRNAGKENLSTIIVRFYHDVNRDSILSENELKQIRTIVLLNTKDSVNVNFTIPRLPQGVHRLAASVTAEMDGDQTNDILFHQISAGMEPYSIVINEIMYAPTGDIPEWVEGYNRTADSIDLKGWKISDNGPTKVPLNGRQMILPPRSYFIVTTDTMQFHTIFPSIGPLFQASFSSLNNTTADAVVLIDDRGEQMDSMMYRPSWGGTGGESLQRFDTEFFTADSSNWRSTVPNAGIENTVSRKERDAEIRRVLCQRRSTGVTVRATIMNMGRQTMNDAVVKIFHDANGNGQSDISELLHSEQLPALLPYDSSVILFEWTTSLHGKQSVIILCEMSGDERSENNKGRGATSIAFPEQSVVINEVMYEPAAGNAEFVELVNRSADTIDIADWRLMDQPGSSGNRAAMVLSDSTLHILPGGYFVLASDSSFFSQFPDADRRWIKIHSSLSLSNSGEDLVVNDLTGGQIDSIRYFPDWHLKNVVSAGRSLERINPGIRSNDKKNWSSSVTHSGASPLSSNSIFTAVTSAHSPLSLSLSPNPFSPDQDGFEDFISINYVLPAVSSMIRIRIYDVTGRLLRRLVQNEPSASTGTTIWNGLDDDGRRVRIGMYIIVLEALDNFGGTVRSIKDVAVVGRRL